MKGALGKLGLGKKRGSKKEKKEGQSGKREELETEQWKDALVIII